MTSNSTANSSLSVSSEMGSNYRAMSEDPGQSPRVTACTPTWNGADFIRKTLDSLAAQTYPNFRVIIADDASSDDTAAICEEYVARDSRFTLLRQRQRLGWVDNANAVLRAAAPHSDYLMFAFHDDVLRPEFVAKLAFRLQQQPSAIVAFSDVECYYQDGSMELRQYDNLEGLTTPAERAELVIRQHGQWSVPNRGVFRAWAATRIGGLKKHMAGEFSADWPWLVHMSLLGEFVRVPEVLCEKYYQKNSLSRGWNFNSWSRIAAALSCGREIYRSDLSLADKWWLQVLLARRSMAWLRIAHKRYVAPRQSAVGSRA